MGISATTARLGSALVAVLAALSLSGCVGEPVIAPSATPSATVPEPSASPSTPQPSPSPEPSATPVDIECSTLISPQAMYDFNPNFVLLNSFSPTAGSPAAQSLEWQGTACRWVHGTSGDAIDVSIASPSASDLDELRGAAQAGEVVKGASADSFFATSGGIGTVESFPSHYWVTVSSVYFISPTDTVLLLGEVLASVR